MLSDYFINNIKQLNNSLYNFYQIYIFKIINSNILYQYFNYYFVINSIEL